MDEGFIIKKDKILEGEIILVRAETTSRVEFLETLYGKIECNNE